MIRAQDAALFPPGATQKQTAGRRGARPSPADLPPGVEAAEHAEADEGAVPNDAVGQPRPEGPARGRITATPVRPANKEFGPSVEVTGVSEFYLR